MNKEFETLLGKALQDANRGDPSVIIAVIATLGVRAEDACVRSSMIERLGSYSADEIIKARDLIVKSGMIELAETAAKLDEIIASRAA